MAAASIMYFVELVVWSGSLVVRGTAPGGPGLAQFVRT